MHPMLLPGLAVVAIGGAIFAYKDKLFKKDGAAPAQVPPAQGGQPLPQGAIPGGTQAPLMPIPAGVPIPPQVPAPPAKPSDPTKAVVTTKDEPPSGDLKVMAGPSNASKQLGGADKNGTVDVIAWNAGTGDGVMWSKIRWKGGRWGAVEGYVKQSFLKPA